MYECHGWFVLAESPAEADTGSLQVGLVELRRLLDGFVWPNVHVELLNLNVDYFLTLTVLVNRRRAEAEHVEKTMQFLAERLPGSWGLLYERDDEARTWPGPNAYRVRRLARGQLEEHGDPFLSPCQPTIEE